MSAGFVDAYVYMAARAFPANMTGNTVLLVISLGNKNLSGGLVPAAALLGFGAGTAMAALMIYKQAMSLSRQIIINRILLFEAFIVAATAFFSSESSQRLLLVMVASVAMGMQGVALLQLGVKGVSTITVTNTITVAVNNFIFKGMAVLNRRTSTEFSSSVQLLTWLVYLISALTAAHLVNKKIPHLLLIPAFVIIAGTIIYSQMIRESSLAR